MYYNEIVAPNLRKAFIDDDFNKCTKMYLVGGGALYPELVDCFKENSAISYRSMYILNRRNVLSGVLSEL